MKVSFVIGGMAISPTGGYKVVFQYANHLVRRGADVTIYYESSGVGSERYFVPRFVKRAIARRRVNVGPTWFDLDERVRQLCIFKIDDDEIEDSDVVIATAVTTALGVKNLSPSKGCKFYFIQDYEKWVYDEETVRSTYCYGMHNIVISHWLEDIVMEASGVKPTYVPDGIDRTVYSPIEGCCVREPNVVSMLYHPGSHKGCQDAVAALVLAKERISDLRVKAFGTLERPDVLPNWFEYTQNATQDQLRILYNSASAHICATVFEGFGLTGLEAMSCGCALISTDYTGVREYADESVALLSPVHDIDALAGNLIKVLKDEDLRKRLSVAGVNRSKKFDLNSSSESFYKTIVDALNGSAQS